MLDSNDAEASHRSLPAYEFERKNYDAVRLPVERPSLKNTTSADLKQRIFSPVEQEDDKNVIAINDAILSSCSDILKHYSIPEREATPELVNAFRCLDLLQQYQVCKLVRVGLKGQEVLNDIFKLAKIFQKHPELGEMKAEVQTMFQALHEANYREQEFESTSNKMVEKILIKYKVHLKAAISKALVRNKASSLGELIIPKEARLKKGATELFPVFINTFLINEEELTEEFRKLRYNRFDAKMADVEDKLTLRSQMQQFTADDTLSYFNDPDYPNILLFKPELRDHLLQQELVKSNQLIPIGGVMTGIANIAMKNVFNEKRIEAFVPPKEPQLCILCYERAGSGTIIAYIATLWKEERKTRPNDKLMIFIENDEHRQRVRQLLTTMKILGKGVILANTGLAESSARDFPGYVTNVLFLTNIGNATVNDPVDMVVKEGEDLDWIAHNIDYPAKESGEDQVSTLPSVIDKQDFEEARFETVRLVRYAIANFSKLSSFVYVTYSDDEVDNEELLNCLLKSYNDALIEKEAVIKKNGKKSYDPQLYVPFSVTSYGRKHALDDEYRSMRPNELRHELLCLDKNEVYVGVCEKRVLAEHERSVAIIKNACERANVELPKEVESSESILKVDTERMLKEIKETVKKQKEEHAKHKSRLTKLYDEEYIRERGRAKVIKVLPHQEVINHPHPFRF